MTDDEHYSVSEATRFSFHDTETIILNTASQREDGIVLPVPKSIKTKPEQAQRKLKRLLKAGVIEEVFAKLEDGLWRKDAEDRHLTLKLTADGRRTFEATPFGESVESAQQGPGSDGPAAKEVNKKPAKESGSRVAQQARKPRPKVASAAGNASGAVKSGRTTPQRIIAAARRKKTASEKKNATAPSATPKAHSQPAKDSKGGQLLAALGRAKGATLEELMKISGWQAHSVRGFLSGMVKKKLQLKLKTEIDSKGIRRYLVVAKRAAS